MSEIQLETKPAPMFWVEKDYKCWNVMCKHCDDPEDKGWEVASFDTIWELMPGTAEQMAHAACAEYIRLYEEAKAGKEGEE